MNFSDPAEPMLSQIMPAGYRCGCGWTCPTTDPAAVWLTAAHEASHDPEAVVLIPAKRAHSLSLVLARAAGWADVLSPAAAFHASLASSVIHASGGAGGRDHVLSVSLVDAVANTAEWTAAVLAETIADQDVIDQLMETADELCDLLTGPSPSPQARRLAAPLAPTVRLNAPDRILASLALALEALEAPLLLPVPPEAETDEQVGARSVTTMTAELAALPVEVSDVERGLYSALRLIARSLRPLPVISDVTLDVIAMSVLDLQLAGLRARHLAETLSATRTPGIADWAKRAAPRITDRMRLLTDTATLVLEELECLA